MRKSNLGVLFPTVFADQKEKRSRRSSASAAEKTSKRMQPVIASMGTLNASIIDQNDLIRSSIQVQESQNALLEGIMQRTGSGQQTAPEGDKPSMLHDLEEIGVWFIGKKIGGGIMRGIRALRGIKPLEGSTIEQGPVKILGKTGESAPVEDVLPEISSPPSVAETLKSPTTTDVLGGWLWPMLSIASDSMHPNDEWMKAHGITSPHVKTIWEWIKEHSSAPDRASDAEIDQSYKDQRKLGQGANMESRRAAALGRLPIKLPQQSSVTPESSSLIQPASYQNRVIPSLRFVADRVSFRASEMKFRMMTGGLGGGSSGSETVAQSAVYSGEAGGAAAGMVTPASLGTAPVSSGGVSAPTSHRAPSRSNVASPIPGAGNNATTAPIAKEMAKEMPQTEGSESYDAMYKQAKINSSTWGDQNMNPQYIQGATHGACLRGVGGVLSSLTGDKRLIAPTGGNADSFSLGNKYLQKTGKFADPVDLPKDYMSDKSQWRIGDTVSASMPGHGGHIQVWDGHTWVSDGKQTGILLHAHGQAYQNYTLHRLNTAGAASLSPAYVADNDTTGATKEFVKDNSTEIASIRSVDPPKGNTPQPTSAANAGPDVPKGSGDAWNSKNTYVIGDSWGVGVKAATGTQGSALTGASASQVLSMIKGNAIKTGQGAQAGLDPSKVKGQNVVLSSGILNSLSHADQLSPEKREALVTQVKKDVADQIATLRQQGAKDIRMMSPDVTRPDLKSLDIPKIVSDIGKDTGVKTFTSDPKNIGKDQLHLTPGGFKQFGQEIMAPQPDETAAAPAPEAVKAAEVTTPAVATPAPVVQPATPAVPQAATPAVPAPVPTPEVAPAVSPPAVPTPAPKVHPEASNAAKSEQITDHVDRVSRPKPQQSAKASGGNTMAGNDMLYSLCGNTA